MTELTTSQRLKVWAAAGMRVTLGPDELKAIADHFDACADMLEAAESHINRWQRHIIIARAIIALGAANVGVFAWLMYLRFA